VTRNRRFAILCLACACASAAAQVAFAGGGQDPRLLRISDKELSSMLAPLSKDIRDGINAEKPRFLELLAQVLDEPPDLLVLVDKRHPLEDGFVPPDLASVNGYQLSRSRDDLRLRRILMPALLEMDRAARAAGVTLLLSSSYRSYTYQASVYAKEVRLYGQEMADRESARPGMSQHQLGTAIDFGSITDDYAETRAGRWLAAHAAEFGFSLSFPKGFEGVTGYKWECWHYRYVGRPAVRLQREFFGDVQQYLMEFLHDNRALLDERWVNGS
jgi:zinc D-Ala-D-Ala carboxypeptidase